MSTHVYPPNSSKTASCYTLLDICKFQSFVTPVEPLDLRGLCATSNLHCNDCGRSRTTFYEPPAIFINILPQNCLNVCRILSLQFIGSAADHVQELNATSDLHCNDRGRPRTTFYEPPAIFINILPQNYLNVCRILSLPFIGSAADHVQELNTTSDLHCNECGRLYTHRCPPPAICIDCRITIPIRTLDLDTFSASCHYMVNPLAKFQLCQSTSNHRANMLAILRMNAPHGGSISMSICISEHPVFPCHFRVQTSDVILSS